MLKSLRTRRALMGAGSFITSYLPRVESLEQRRLLSSWDMDPSFDVDGRKLVTLVANPSTADIAVQSDGKVLALATTRAGTRDAILTRVTSAGKLDTTFGGGDGIVTLDVGGKDNYGTALLLMPDGKIVVGGNVSGGTYYLAQFNADGTLDTSGVFGGSTGIVTGTGSLTDLALSGGNIISGGDAVVRRHNADGSLDATFGAAGSADLISLGALTSYALGGITVQSDGKIIATGTGQKDGESIDDDVIVVRLMNDGTIDAGFSTDGVVVADAFFQDSGVSAAMQSDGKIVVLDNGSVDGTALIRLNDDGTFDNSWASSFADGFIPFSMAPSSFPGDPNQATSLLIQPDGKILVGGFYLRRDLTGMQMSEEFVVRRFNAVDGTPDTSFSGDGIATTDFYNGIGEMPADRDDEAYAMALAPGGQIVLGGVSKLTSPTPGASADQRLALARFLPNPSGATVALSLDGKLTITGTDGRDLVSTSIDGDNLLVHFDEQVIPMPMTAITSIVVTLGASRDSLDFGPGMVVPTTIDGGAGQDTIYGGPGADSISAGASSGDAIYGNDGRDTLIGGSLGDTLEGNGDDDSILGNGGDDVIDGGGGADYVDAGAGNDFVNGEEGNDSILGGEGNDTLDGGADVDTLVGGSGNNLLFNGESPAGTDPISVTPAGILVINGTAAANTISVQGDSTTIYVGYDGVIDIIPGDSIVGVKIDGMDGDDSLTSLLSDIPVTLIGGKGNDSLFGSNGNDSLSGGDGDDRIVGNEGNDKIDGGIGNDDIDGGSGDDKIDCGAGNDTALGGDGNDTITGGADADVLDGGNDVDSVTGGGPGDVTFNGENPGGNSNPLAVNASGVLVIPGRDVRDVVYVDMSIDNTQVVVTWNEATATFDAATLTGISLSGGKGNDDLGASDLVVLPMTLDGGDGDDALMGGSGNDVLRGGKGADDMSGMGGIDTADYGDRTDNLTIGLGVLADDGGVGEHDNVRNDIEIVIGGSGNDSIRGSINNNTLIGGKGNDTLYGLDGGDKLLGGDGNDVIYGQIGNDSIEGGNGDDKLYGGAGNDTITGNAGLDLMNGEEGNDTFFARDTQKDTIDGGIGTDKAQKDPIDSLTNVETLLA